MKLFQKVMFTPLHKQEWFQAIKNHSPLEGESAKQGRSPPASRWGDPSTPHALNRPSTPPQPLPERRRPPLARPVLLASRPRRERRRGLQPLAKADTNHPPPLPPAPSGLAAPTPPQGGSDWRIKLFQKVIFTPLPRTGIFRAIKNHSPLEGESAKQGRSPPASRWGDPSTPCPQPPLHPPAAPAQTPKAASDTAGAASIPTSSKTAPGAFNPSPKPARTTPHRCRRRLAAWRHRLPLKGGVIGG